MALKHRVIQRVPIVDDDPNLYFDKAGSALESWLTTRRGAPSLSKTAVGSEMVSIGADYHASRERITVDGFVAERWRIRVGEAPHIYDTRVTLAVHTVRQVGWLQYDIDASRADSAFTAPLLTSFLTRSLESRTADSIANFSEGLRVIRKDAVGDFLDNVLNNPERTVTAFVTGSRAWNDAQDRAFERRFSALHGVATFWRLDDDALDEFNALVDAGYRVFPGSVHVFQPNLDTEDPLDVRRHWWFSAAEVADTSEKDFWMRLHTQAMRWALRQPLPAALQLVNSEFGQARSSAISELFSPKAQADRQNAIARMRGAREARNAQVRPENFTPTVAVEDLRTSPANLTPAPRTDSSNAYGALDNVIDLLADAESLLGIKRSHELDLSGRFESILWAALDQTVGVLPASEAVRLEVEQAHARIADLESEVDELSALLQASDDVYEHAQGEIQAQRSLAEQQRRRADHLGAELARVTYADTSIVWDVPVVEIDDPISQPAPSTVEDLLAQLHQLQAVQFTGSRKWTDKITSAKLRSAILNDAWTFACELELYARQWKGGVHGLRRYAEEISARITAASFAPDESSDIKSNPKFYEPRTLPVPATVNESEEVFMGAHFKLSQNNGKAMRMHVYDAVHVDGRIYIGYIGEHLPSRLTT